MIRSTLSLLATSALFAQYPLSLELDGEWRMSADDQPAYARPDFDDRAWARVQLPWKRNPGDGVFWLRRAVELPPGADRSRLAITLGTVRPIYELYVNGERIGATSPFFDDEQAHIPQPRTFSIPPSAAGSGATLQVAIRGRQVDSPIAGGGAFRVTSAGPYRLTYQENAPLYEGRRFIDGLKAQRASVVGFSALLAGLGVLLLGLWLADRGRMELFWLAGVALARCANQIIIYFKISLDSTPWSEPSWTVITIAAGGISAGELALGLSGLPRRWLRAAIWLPWLAVIFFLKSETSAPLELVPLFMLVAGTWRMRAWRLEATRQLTLLMVALLMVTRFNSRASAIFGSSFDAAGQYWSWQTMMLTLLCAILAFLLVRQLTLDRRERQRLSAELEAAKAVQQLLLPADAAPAGAFTVDAVYEPAQEVGGDFYWTRATPDGALLVVVGDVSGKGLKAAMLVSVAVGILRNEKSASPGALLAALNDGLAGHTGGGFVTGCCARFDSAGTVTIANAGHPVPYADGREATAEAGLPLGVMAGVTYAESVTRGERFTFVSDGVIEASNARDELFGFDRTASISAQSARGIADAAKAWGQNDDITVVTVRRNS